MAPASATTATPTRRARRPPPRRSPAARVSRKAMGAIRWDRLGRLALLAMMAGILVLYVGPARTWLSTWQESKERRAEVLQLRAENRRLRARRRELQSPGALEAEARRLGMVHQGERAYVVRGLPSGR